jgi:hypothetical protein
MEMFDVEAPQPLFDQVLELPRERSLLDVVLSLDQVDGMGLAVGDLLPDGRWRRRQKASRIALTIVRANSVLIRSRALRSF